MGGKRRIKEKLLELALADVAYDLWR